MAIAENLYVYYSIINPDMPDDAFTHYLHQLPRGLHADVMKYHQHADRVRTLTGKLLLKEAVQQAGLSPALMENMGYTNYKRPFIAKDVDFNITHAGNCVACVAGRGMRVGIDVEDIKPIQIDDILAVLRDEELHEMRRLNADPETILRFWTRKEAIVKASGEGLYLPPQSIYFINELTATTPECTWYLHELDLGAEYIAYCVTNVEGSETILKKINY
jgi:4'-phosphopantetheinyl transferase